MQAAEDTPEAGEAEDTPEEEAGAKDAPVEAIEEGVSGATEADIDVDYVADVIAAQGTWDPWPTPDQDDWNLTGLDLIILIFEQILI